MRLIGMLRRVALAALLAGAADAAVAQDTLKIAVGQRGGWEQCVSELGQNAGIFKQQGLALDVLYTQGSGETLQSVISASVDIGIGVGTHSLLGAYAKGAPVRAIGSSFTSADDQFYYVAADAPVRSMKDADGKSIAISTTGSASNIFALALARHFGVALKPQPTGAYAATLTQTLTRQVDIGFSQAPFNLNAVEEGRIRIIAMGRDVPELRQMTSRLIIANTAILAAKKPLIARYLQGFVATLDWLYSDPAAIKAYAAWSGLPEGIARRAPEFLTKQNLDPRHISGLDAIMADAVKFKYLPAQLTQAQLAEVIQIPLR
jgi:ABC-type nitrate/sulfonate/bicarbonate transport system substrate-binding protein